MAYVFNPFLGGLDWTADGITDHGVLTGLSDDDHAQYALLAGRFGGQTLLGGTAASENLVLRSTAHATKGLVTIGNTSTGFLSLDETNRRVGINTGATSYALDVRGTPVDIGYLAKFEGLTSPYSTYILLVAAGANEQAGFSLFQSTHNEEWRYAVIGNGADSFRVSNTTSGNVWFMTVPGNMLLDSTHTSNPSTGSKVFILGDGTAPTGMASNTAGLYADDVSGTVNLFGINEAGETTRLTWGTPQTYAESNVTTDRTYDANATSLDELADVLGTLLADLRARGIIL